MTPEGEDVRARQCQFPADADLPRLFGDAPVSAVEGAGGCPLARIDVTVARGASGNAC